MMLCREDLPECDTDELIEMLASQWNKRAGDRQPAPSETVGVKGVGMSDLLDLLASANQLNEIVEGVRETRWAFDDMRLKDTKEWCDFYVKLKRAARRSNEKLRHGANNPNA